MICWLISCNADLHLTAGYRDAWQLGLVLPAGGNLTRSRRQPDTWLAAVTTLTQCRKNLKESEKWDFCSYWEMDWTTAQTLLLFIHLPCQVFHEPRRNKVTKSNDTAQMKITSSSPFSIKAATFRSWVTASEKISSGTPVTTDSSLHMFTEDHTTNKSRCCIQLWLV